MRPGRGLGQVVHSVTLLNTDSNLINTVQRIDNLKIVGEEKSRAAGKRRLLGSTALNLVGRNKD